MSRFRKRLALNRTGLVESSAGRPLIAQLLRYAVSGGAAALLYSAVYWVLAFQLAMWPIAANILAWLAALMSSYVLHSRWSFRRHAQNPASGRSKARFLVVNLAGLLLNSFWVWLMVHVLGADVRTPLIPILSITPWLMFYASRQWVFR